VWDSSLFDRDLLRSGWKRPAFANAIRTAFQLSAGAGASDEDMTVLAAEIDASNAPERAGASHEGEDLEVIRCGIDAEPVFIIP